MRLTLPLIAMACCLGALPAGASAPLARLVEPADGAVLVPGELAWLAWKPTRAMAERPEISEWEAFLSLDGGHSYPFRITPHLSKDDSRVLFRVPAFASDDVRLLLRFGDERDEHEVEMAARLEIQGASGVVAAGAAQRVRHRGEAARPGEPGTVYWLEGDRHGRDLRPLEASGEDAALGSKPSPSVWALSLAIAPLASSPQLAPPVATELGRLAGSAVDCGRSRSKPMRSRPILSLHQRLNT